MNRLTAGLAVLLVLAGITVRLGAPVPAKQTPDEYVYSSFSNRLVTEGWGASRKMVSEYLLDPAQWTYPPPTRAGYLTALAVTMKVTGRTNERSGLPLSFVSSALALCVTAWVALRFLNPYGAAAAIAFAAFSPLELAITRRTWQDSWMALWGAILAGLAAEMVSRPRGKFIAPFAAAGAVASVSKESGVVAFVLAALWVFFCWVTERKRLETLFLMLAVLTSLELSLLVLGNWAGGFGELVAVWRRVKEAVPQNAYAVEYQDGPWWSFLAGLWALSPGETIFALAGVAAAVAAPFAAGRRGAGRDPVPALRGWVFLFFALMAAAAFPRYFKNLRYLSAVYAPFHWMAGAGAACFAAWLVPRVKRGRVYGAILFAAVIACAASVDYGRFGNTFASGTLNDLAVKRLVEAGEPEKRLPAGRQAIRA